MKQLDYTDIEACKAAGFVYEHTFPGEYDLWVHKRTFATMRRRVDGSVWVKDAKTGVYDRVVKPKKEPI
jgi:hypothetical protein